MMVEMVVGFALINIGPLLLSYNRHDPLSAQAGQGSKFYRCRSACGNGCFLNLLKAWSLCLDGVGAEG